MTRWGFRSLRIRWERHAEREMALFPNDDARQEAYLAVTKDVLQGRYYGVILMVGVPLAMVASRPLVYAVIAALPGPLPLPSDVIVFASFAGAIPAIFGGYFWFMRHRIRRYLRMRLLNLGIPVCLRCGYDLRGQTEPRCPECGREFDPGLLESPTRRNADVEPPGETAESSRKDFGT